MISTTTVDSLFDTGIQSFWDYLTTILPTFITFLVGVAVVGVVVWIVIKAVRHIVSG